MDMSLAAGRMRHRVNIQERVDVQDAVTGGNSFTWSTVYSNVPCAIESLSVREFLQSQADQSEVSVRIVMRKLSGFTFLPTQRLVGACGCHEGKIYNPQGWLEDKTTGQEYVTTPCKEGVNQGA